MNRIARDIAIVIVEQESALMAPAEWLEDNTVSSLNKDSPKRGSGILRGGYLRLLRDISL